MTEFQPGVAVQGEDPWQRGEQPLPDDLLSTPGHRLFGRLEDHPDPTLRLVPQRSGRLLPAVQADGEPEHDRGVDVVTA